MSTIVDESDRSGGLNPARTGLLSYHKDTKIREDNNFYSRLQIRSN